MVYLVKQMRGSIHVKSKKGVGSIFHIVLPCHRDIDDPSRTIVAALASSFSSSLPPSPPAQLPSHPSPPLPISPSLLIPPSPLPPFIPASPSPSSNPILRPVSQPNSGLNHQPQTKKVRHVLIVEDNILNQKLLVRIMKLAGIIRERESGFSFLANFYVFYRVQQHNCQQW